MTNHGLYESRVYPELAEQGIYCPYCTYSYREIQDLIEFAALRRVIGEFNLLGHARGEWIRLKDSVALVLSPFSTGSIASRVAYPLHRPKIVAPAEYNECTSK